MIIGPRPTPFDAFVAAALTAAAVFEVFWAPDGKYPLALVLPTAVALGATLLFRRTLPLVALGLLLVVVVFQRVLLGELWDSGSTLAIPMVGVYSVAAFCDLRRALFGLAATVLVLSVADIGDGTDVAFIALIYGAIWIAGRAVQRQRRLTDQVAEYAVQLAQTQHLREAAAGRDERARIARELHDVVAHCVSTIVVQAEAGQAVLGRDPGRAGDSFISIQQTGRQALEELRRMLGLLRSDDGETSAELGPAPSLQQLDALLASVRAAGLGVTLHVEGTPTSLPTGIDLSAFRIVQEALTNSLKHASATQARVVLQYGPEDLCIEVSDNGHGSPASVTRYGHGLRGMTERAHLLGGQLRLDTGSAGGLAVRTRIPLG